ncbi:uncharacterized protein LOC134978244 [Pseudophryne corroboree]|uniref:uncharacterized protein LOC134978244 n=1 Tax=Pseudophryne corroboree TaxID=495146 RepID=UPI003081F367
MGMREGHADVPLYYGTKLGGMSRDQRPHALHSSHSSEDSLASGEGFQPTNGEESHSAQRTTSEPCPPKKTVKKNTQLSQHSRREEEHSGGASDDQDDGKKSTCGPQFSESENCALVDAVEKHYERLYGTRAQTTAPREKQRLWKEISDKVTVVSSILRDSKHCKKPYSDCHRQTKKKMAMLRRHEQGTGGGPELIIHWLNWEDIIRARLNPIRVAGVPGRMDSHNRTEIPAEEAPRRAVVCQVKQTSGPQKSDKRLGNSGPKRTCFEELPEQRTATQDTRSNFEITPRRDQNVSQEVAFAQDSDELFTLGLQAIPSTLFESSGVTDVTFEGFQLQKICHRPALDSPQE